MANEIRETADETDVSTDETADETPETGAEASEPDESRQDAENVEDSNPTVDEAGETAEETGATSDETSATVDETHETADESQQTGASADETASESGETADETAGQADESAAAAETDGAADATSGEAAQSGDVDGSGNGPARGATAGGSRTRVAAVVLGAAVVVLAAFGVWATLEAHSLRATAAPPNIAVTNGAATSAVNRQIVSAVNTVFSYNYADTGATRQAAQGLLTGAAIRQYNTYFALVTKDAPAQKLVVTTRVTNSGVELLSGNRAQVLVFANQQDTRADTSQSSYAGALFAVTAVRQGGRWKIDNIDTFNGQE